MIINFNYYYLLLRDIQRKNNCKSRSILIASNMGFTYGGFHEKIEKLHESTVILTEWTFS